MDVILNPNNFPKTRVTSSYMKGYKY